MYKVILADDNKLVLDSLYNSIPWEQLQCKLTDMAADGLTALNLIKTKKPDLFISDIKMPGLDGLQIAKQIQEENLQCKIILITGYGELEYARQAIHYGVSDFILKPIDDKELILAIKKAITIISTDQINLHSIIHEYTIRYQINLITFQKLEYGLKFKPHWGFCIHILPLKKDQTIPSEDLIEEKLVKHIKDLNQNIYVYAFYEQNKITLTILVQQNDNIQELRVSIVNLLTSFMEKIDSRGFATGVGCLIEINSNEGLGRSYNGSIRAAESLRFFPYNKNKTYLFDEQLVDEPEKLNKLSHILSHLEKAEHNERLSIINTLASFIKNSSILPSNTLKDMLKGGLLSLIINLELTPLTKSPGPDVIYVCRLIDEAYTWDECIQIFKEIINLYRDNNFIGSNNTLVKKALSYIAEKYDGNLTLESVATYCAVSASHLSRIIKAETGQSFCEILNKVRIFQAIRFLKTSNLKIYEAAFKVGFENPAYFNQVFKRITGKSPREYISKS